MISLQVTQGSQPGRWQEFTADSVSVGRGPQPDFSVDNADSTVSRGVHLRIHEMNDHDSYLLRVENLKSNPVFVIFEEEVLAELAEGESRDLSDSFHIQIGENGPILSVSSDQFLSPTIKENVDLSKVRVSAVKAKSIDEVEAKSRFSMKVSLVAFSLIFIGAYFIYQLNLSDQEQNELLLDLDSYMSEVASLASESKEFSQQNFAELESSLESLRGDFDNSPEIAITAKTREIIDSVYRVGLKNSDGSFSNFGTAWKIGPKALATNAHVIEGINETLKTVAELGSTLPKIMVMNYSPEKKSAVEVQVTWMKSHGGYSIYVDGHPNPAFKFGPDGSPQVIPFLPVFDVGLIQTESELPGIALTIADSNDFADLKAGDSLGMVGFPAAGTGDSGNPEPVLSIGRLLSLMDGYGGSAPLEHRIVLGVDLQAGPGSSGSPIITSDGKVVGLLTFAKGGDLHSFQFAQRADLVQSMLIGMENAQFSVLEKHWQAKRRDLNIPEAQADALVGSGLASIRQYLSEYHGSSKSPEQIAEMIQPVEVYGGTRQFSQSGPNVIELWDNLEAGGFYVLIAISNSGSDIDLAGRYADGSGVKDEAPDNYPLITFATNKGIGIDLNLILPSNRQNSEEIFIKLVRALPL